MLEHCRNVQRQIHERCDFKMTFMSTIQKDGYALPSYLRQDMNYRHFKQSLT